MFRQRLLTTLVLAPLVLLLIYYVNYWIFFAVLTVILAVCTIEWLQLIPIQLPALKIVYISFILIAGWFCQFVFSYWLLLNELLWGGVLIAILTFPRSQDLWGRAWLIALLGLLFLPAFAQSMLKIYQHPQGKELFVFLLFLVWATDIGAYLTGKLCGKHKLIPRVSPGKTVEGASGGFVLALFIAFLGYFYFQPINATNWFLLTIATLLISMVGDLAISMLKRRCNLKDTGNLLPGHGGILDRLDSLIAALPLFYCGLVLLPPGI